MTAVFGLVIGLCLLVMGGLLPSLFGEISYTLLMMVSFFALLRLGRQAAALRWQYGIYALSLAAAIAAVGNLAWVYGSVAGGLPLGLEFLGATLWTLQSAPWAYALSLAIFVVYKRLSGAVFMELVAQLILLASSVTFIIAVVLGFVLGLGTGIAIADNATIYFSALLVVPAVALWFSGTGFSKAESRFTHPFLLLSFATLAWFLADLLYVRLPDTYNVDMIYNVLASLQWLLVYVASAQYLKSGLAEAKVLVQTLPVQPLERV